jgi:quercetin dioxygenase-like cupin family protein
MKCLRIYATPDGESHFGDADIPTIRKPLFPNEAPFQLSGHYAASRIRLVHVPAGVREAGWHIPPGRVLAVWLDGIVEFETSDGEVRRISAGSSVLVEDTHGKGYISRHPAEGQSLILITLPHGLDRPEFG